MAPLASYLITLASAGVIAFLLHTLIVWLGVGDLVALLIFGAPVCAYIAYCCHQTRKAQSRAALQIYLSFALVVSTSAALVQFLS